MKYREKIAEIIKKNGTYNSRSLSFDYYVVQPDDLAKALIAEGIGEVKETKFESDHYWRMWQGALVESERAEHRAEVAEKALDTVYKEACEKYEKEIKQLMRKVFGDYIANGIGGYIDNIKERLLEEGYEH